MKIKVLNIIVFLFCIFFLRPLCAKADFGDVRYDITNVSLSGENITFEGWAFIHKTNNYTSVESAGLTGGDQKILMRAIKANGDEIETKVVSGSDRVNYNFYCELFYTANGFECNSSNYKNKNFNTCDPNSYGDSYCYYEDIYFKITFDTSTWNISNNENVRFKLAVSNSDFESERGNYSGEYEYNGDYFTRFLDVSISNAAVSNTGNDYITIDSNSFDNNVKFIANYGRLLDPTDSSSNFYLDSNCAYGEYRDGYNMIYTFANNITGYNNGRSEYASRGRCADFLGDNCKGTYYYAIKVNQSLSNTDKTCDVATPCSGSNCKIAVARGSHIQLSGNTTFIIRVNNRNRCPIVISSAGDLNCNDSKTFTSNCNELSVITSVGRVEVKIEQTGTVSSVLIPDENNSKTFAGGGFNFGAMYYNTIKWDYVGTAATGELHRLVKEQMENKIKDYDTYISRINISQLRLGGVHPSFNNLNRKCTTSSTGKDYYRNELTVSCVFTFPESTLHYNGNVTYAESSNNININNKYYTPVDYKINNDRDSYYDYKLEASIEGMNRITDAAARSDSAEQGTSWTGIWDDTFEDCEINLYSLLINDGKYNFIYRPIDLNNPFPNRNAGINWYDWISIDTNRQRLIKTYNRLGYTPYTAVLNNSTIASIKEYNKNPNNDSYLEWNDINANGYSSFVNTYVTRESGS